jgi:uncharacterized repeat protein (TIGR01451 family)
MYRVPSRSPRSGGGGSAGRLRRWLLPVALCAASGGIALGPALPAMAMGSPDTGSRVAQDAGAGTAGLPASMLPQQAPQADLPALPGMPGSSDAVSGPSQTTFPDSSASSARNDGPKGGMPWSPSSTVSSTQVLVAKIPGSCCHENWMPSVPPVPPCGCTPPPPPCPCPPHHHPKLWIAKSADHKWAKAGDTVTYTVRFRNTGDVPFGWDHPAVITDHLSGVLENASFVSGSLDSSTGRARFDSGAQTITWRGWLTPGQSGWFSYQVKVKPLEDEDTPESLDNYVTAPHSNCVPGHIGPECRVHIPLKHCKKKHHHHHKCHKPKPVLAHTGAGGTAETGWAALACLTGGGALTYGARRAKR